MKDVLMNVACVVLVGAAAVVFAVLWYTGATGQVLP